MSTPTDGGFRVEPMGGQPPHTEFALNPDQCVPKRASSELIFASHCDQLRNQLNCIIHHVKSSGFVVKGTAVVIRGLANRPYGAPRPTGLGSQPTPAGKTRHSGPRLGSSKDPMAALAAAEPRLAFRLPV